MQQQVKIYQSFDQFYELQQKWIKQEHEEEKKFIQKLSQELTHQQIIQLGYGLGKLKLIKTKITFGNRQVLVFEGQVQQEQNQNKVEQDNKQENKQENTFRLKQGDQVGIYYWTKILQQQKFQSPEAVGVIDRYKKHLRIILEQNSSNIKDDNILYGICILENFVTYKRHMQVIDDIKQNFEKLPIIRALFSDEGDNRYNKKLQEYEFFSDTIKQLNEQQQIAVQNAMTQTFISLIHGPPGTGKTRTVCEYIKQAVLVQKQKILACANSNIAVDNMIERLQTISNLKICRIGNPARMTDQVRYVCIDQLVKKTSSYAILKDIKLEIQQLEKKYNRNDKKDKDLKKKIKEKQKEQYEQEQLAYEEAISDCQVIFSTNVGSGQFQFQQLTKNIKFDVVVIDECAQSLEISCWIPILKGNKVVLAGDHCQLPPTIKVKNTGLEMTLFERIEKEHKINTQLTIQYRMNKQIMQWSSNEFYNGNLIADQTVENQTISDTILLFIDTSSCDFYEQQQESLLFFDDQNKSKYNEGESGLVEIIIDELLNLGVQKQDIGVITPYNAQVQLIKKKIEDIEISTVDGFQGREKECIVISMVRSNKQGEVGFLSESRRMNVAITRAKKFVCLIGNSDTVSNDPFLKRLIEYFQTNGDVRSAEQYLDNDKISIPINVGQQNQDKTNQKKKKKKDKKPKQLAEQQIQQQQQNIGENDINQQSNRQENQNNQQPQVSQYEIAVQNFLNSNDLEIKFQNQNGFQRKELHELAEKYQLQHESLGDGKLKTLILKKQQIDAKVENEAKELEPKPNIEQVVKEEEIKKPESKQIQQQNQEKMENQQKNQNQKDQKQKQQQQQQQQKQKQQQQNQKKTKEQLQKEEDDFFDSIPLLDEKKCAFMKNSIQCNKPLNLLSLTCNFCHKKYCQYHHLAEEHGCDEAACQHARKQFLSNTYEHEKNKAIMLEKIKKSEQDRQKKKKK